MAWPGCGQHPLGHGRVRHLRGGGGDFRADGMQVANLVIIPFPKEVPDGRLGRGYVRLIAAMRDHVMGAMLGAQVLAAKIPADVHQFHCIEGTPSRPG